MNNDNSYINETCPVCGQVGEAWHKMDVYEIDRCASCGFVYVKNVPSDLELFKFYEEYYKGNDTFRPNLDKGRKLKYKAIAKFIEMVSSKDQIKLLELGCSQGYLLEAVKDNPRISAEGLDYVKGAVEYAQSLGLKVTQSSVEAMHYPAENFDFLVALHVMEHVQNLDQTMEEIKRILKKGAHLYFVVPCISHIKGRLAGKKWHYLGPPGHLWYFTTKSMKFFLAKHGFEVKIASTLSNRAHLRVLAVKK